jgi:hypothetical protein
MNSINESMRLNERNSAFQLRITGAGERTDPSLLAGLKGDCAGGRSASAAEPLAANGWFWGLGEDVLQEDR